MAGGKKSYATYLHCVLLLAACAFLLVEARTGRTKKSPPESTISDYVWAALKLGLAFSPVLLVGLTAGCSKESAVIEAKKAKLNESCKT